MHLTPGQDGYWIRGMTTSEGAEMEVQFHEGTVSLPVTGTRTGAVVEAGETQQAAQAPRQLGRSRHACADYPPEMGTAPASSSTSERRKTGRRYLVYLRGRTTAEVFYDYTGSYLAHQDRGGWVFYTKAPVAGEPIEKVWIPWHRIVSVEIVG